MEKQVVLTQEAVNALDFLLSMASQETMRSENGTILLDRNNESDREWFDDK